MVLAEIIFYLRKIESGEGKTREGGGLYREGELRKKNEEMKRRWMLLEHGEQKKAHSAFIALCFRENIFLIFEEVSGKERRTEGEAKAIKGEEKSGERREMQKGISEGEEEGRDTQERRRVRRFLLRREYIFHLPDDARDGSNHDYGSNNSRDFES